MAFIRDYEWQDSGAIIPNAYHVVTGVKVTKRSRDIPPPVDIGRPSGFTDRDDTNEEEWIYWKAGYVAEVTVTIWSSKQARIDGKKAIGFMGINPTETEYEGNVGTKGMDGKCVFFVDPESNDSYVTQAYKHLRQFPYYADAIIDDDPVSTDDDEYVEGANTDPVDSANT
jgi:hypothetical protein